MKFTLTIDLGNDGMRTAADLAYAIENVTAQVVGDDDDPYVGITDARQGRKVMDRNGNIVGAWAIVEPSERYTLEAGRSILRDGHRFIGIKRHEGDAEGNGYVSPTDVDRVTVRIVQLLNLNPE